VDGAARRVDVRAVAPGLHRGAGRGLARPLRFTLA
jgi:hypothetical protein